MGSCSLGLFVWLIKQMKVVNVTFANVDKAASV